MVAVVLLAVPLLLVVVLLVPVLLVVVLLNVVMVDVVMLDVLLLLVVVVVLMLELVVVLLVPMHSSVPSAHLSSSASSNGTQNLSPSKSNEHSPLVPPAHPEHRNGLIVVTVELVVVTVVLSGGTSP